MDASYINNEAPKTKSPTYTSQKISSWRLLSQSKPDDCEYVLMRMSVSNLPFVAKLVYELDGNGYDIKDCTGDVIINLDFEWCEIPV